MRRFSLASAALAVILALFTFGADEGNAAYLHRFDCEGCHFPGTTYTTLEGANVCLRCHGPAGATIEFNLAGGLKTAATTASSKFATGDASNAMGSYPTGGTAPTPISQTSHNWASPDVNPAAGALAPTNAALTGRSGTSAGRVTCSRCHDPHGDGTTNPKLLRTGAGSEDAMCRDCHRNLAQSVTHGLGAHPVLMNYATVAGANPDGYKPAVDNGATNGGITVMADGTISCLSCHGVHAVDSNAGTIDGFGAAGATGSGDGLMLKHNGPAREAVAGAAQSMCLTCHQQGPHGATGSLGCLVCHGGHDPDEQNPNYYSLRKEMVVDASQTPDPTDGPGMVTIPIDYTTLTEPGASPDYNGVCNSCHQNALPAGHLPTWLCADCHSHTPTDGGGGSFSPSCGSCHGFPPTVNAPGNTTPGGYAVDSSVPSDYNASGVFKNESLTPHKTHSAGTAGDYSFSCDMCHGASSNSGSHAGHKDANFQQVLNTGSQPLDALTTGNGYFSGGTAPTYAGTCTNVACHSNGGKRVDDGIFTFKTAASAPVWANGAGTISSCNVCHGNDVTSMGSSQRDNSVAHAVHLGLTGVTCKTCHVATAASATTLVSGAIGTTHVNGTRDVAFDTSGFITVGATPYVSASGTCAVYCHSNGRVGGFAAPDWDEPTSGDCGACHQYSNAGVAAGSGLALGGAHAKHLYIADGGVQLACTICHTNAGSGDDHVNGALSMVSNYQTDVCNVCHGAIALQTVGDDREPVWTQPLTVDCQTCHAGVPADFAIAGGSTAPDKTAATASGHNKVSGTYASGKTAANKQCEDCHDAAAAGHFDAAGDARLTGGFSCNSCHAGVNTHHAKECQDCHDVHGTSNWYMIYASQATQNAKDTSGTDEFGGDVVFTALTGQNSFDDNDAIDLTNLDDICATCHATTTHNNRADSNTHIDASTHEGENCLSSCHKPHTDAAPFSGSASNCEGCHSVKLAEPRHAAHINIASSVDADLSECAICHPSAAVYTPAGGSPDHFSNSANDFAAGITNPQAAGTTCSSAMGCHKSSVGDGSWQDADGLNCDACHYQAADPMQAGNTGDANPLSAGHNAHFATGGVAVCTDCHNTVSDTSHISNAGGSDAVVLADRANALQDEALINVAVGFNTGTNSCSTASCHNNGRPGTSVPTSAWGSDDPNCSQCHLASPTTGSHAVHILDTNNCSTCHTSALKDASYVSVNHLDGNVDVAAGGYPTNKTVNTAFTNCSNATCHNDGRNGGVTQTWGTGLGSCSECHATQPTTGSHSEHLAAGATCGTCHSGAVQGTTAPAQHRDSTIDTVVGLGYTQNKTLGSAFTTCSTASCHNNAQSSDGTAPGTVVVSPVWGNTAAVCGGCHSNSPTTAKHDEHLGTYGATCVDCHQGAGTGATMPTANHLDSNIDILASLNYSKYVVGGMTPGDGWGTCTNPNAGCHGTPEARPWDNSASSCNSCHGASGATGAPLIGTDMMSTLPLGSHNAHVVTKGYTCNICHNGHGMPTLDNKITIAFTGLATGGTYNPPAIWTTGKWLYNQTSTTGTQDCSNLYCHSSVQANGGVNAPTFSTPDWGNAASGACGTCHASSPTSGSHTPHINDGAVCNTCHSGNVHVDQLIDVTVGAYTSAGAPRNGYGTCSTASCHDQGRGGLKITSTWGTTINDCTECHAGAAISTGSHIAHISAGSTCANCHDAATNVATQTVPATGHRDTNIDTNVALGYSQNKTKDTAFTTCATASCHNDGRNGGLTQTWGMTLNNCSECHATVPTTGGHGKHVGVSFGGATIGCGSCHSGATQGTTAPAQHRDSNLDVTGYATPNKALGSAFTTCTTASCHQDGLVNTTHYVATPVWDANTANCTQCHAAVPATGSHVAHVTTAGKDCSDCHTGATKDTSYASAQHGDLNIDVAVGGYAANKAIGSSYAGCTNLACHSDGMAATGTAPTWGNSLGCAACHLSNMNTGSHTKHLAEADCGACHADAVKDTTAPTGGVHADGNVDVYNTAAGDLGYPNDVAYGNGTWATCNAASCHDMGRGGLATTPAWGVSKTDCSECHAGATISTGSHAAHISAGSTCANCHDAATNVATETAPAAGHRDTNIDTNVALGYSPNKTKDTAFTTCATASCHNDGRNSGLTQTWGMTLNNCSECHATVPTTGGHGKHVGVSFGGATIGCGSCHSGATQGTTAPAQHRDGNLDVTGYDSVNKALGSAFTTCSTASCHQSGLTANDYVPTPVWDGNTANCSQCHPASPTSGSHAKHIAFTGDCSTCHTSAVKDTSYIAAAHGDLNIDTAAALGYTPNKGLGSAYVSCTTASCHNNAQSGDSDGGTTAGTVVVTPAWGNTAAVCGGCHSNSPSSAKHDEHLGTYGATCGDCHVNAGDGSTIPTSNHLNGSIDVGNKSIYTAGGAPGNGWGTCTNSAVGCHPSTTRAWDASASGCNSCHGYPPTPADGKAVIAIEAKGAHQKHVTHIAALASKTLEPTTDTFQNHVVCGVCHDVSTDTNHSLSGGPRNLLIPAATYQFGVTAPTFNGSVGQSSSVDPKSCSSVSCHFRETPVWAPVGGE